MLIKSISNSALVLANLIPLIGVLFYEWDATLVLALYWIENLIIGGFNVTKMLAVIVYKADWAKLMLIVFFVIHYGLFWTGHGILLWDLLGFDSLDPSTVFGREFPGLFDLGAEGAAIMAGFIDLHEPVIWIGISGLVLSHLVSFIEYFVLRGEIYQKDVNALMMQPYKNVVILHAGLLGGAFLLNYFQSPVWLLATIVVLKIVYDARQHTQRHSGAEPTLS